MKRKQLWSLASIVVCGVFLQACDNDSGKKPDAPVTGGC